MNESWQHGGQVKAPVESPRSFRQVAPRILGLTDCVIAAADGTLDVAEHDIGPTRALGLGGGTTTSGVQHGVRMTKISEAPKARQTVAEDFSIGGQAPLCPIQHRVVAEAPDGLDDRKGGPLQGFVGAHGNHECLLVFRASPPLAAVALAAEVGVIDLHETHKLASFFALRHRLHDLLLHPPGAAVAHAKVALERQGRQVGLAASEQVHRQEPRRQRQLRGFKQCPAGERGLMPARTALVVDAALATEARARPAIAARAAVALRPARLVQRPVALGFGAVALEELGHRQALLELHPIHRHGRTPGRNRASSCTHSISNPATAG